MTRATIEAAYQKALGRIDGALAMPGLMRRVAIFALVLDFRDDVLAAGNPCDTDLVAEHAKIHAAWARAGPQPPEIAQPLPYSGEPSMTLPVVRDVPVAEAPVVIDLMAALKESLAKRPPTPEGGA